MTMLPVGSKLRAKENEMFPPEDARRVIALLENDCAAFDDPRANPQLIERVRCAVTKSSQGSVARLKLSIQLANTDWRDALVAAGFGNDPDAHLSWLGSSA